MRYLAPLSPGKVALWCFQIWYAATLVRHFDPARAIVVSLAACAAFVIVVLGVERVACTRAA